MNSLLDRLFALPPRWRFLLIGMGSWGLLGAGMIIGLIDHLNPCPLCIFQRLLYIVLGMAGWAGAMAHARNSQLAAAGTGLAICLGGLSTAGYQTYMQQFPHLVAECGFTEPTLIEQLVYWLGDQWEFMFLATGLCTSKDWTFLGLTMANWSIPAFGFFAGLCIWAALPSGRSRASSTS